MLLLVGAHIDCCHSHTGLDITDAGLKDFSAALASSTTITIVVLHGKFAWLVCSYEWSLVLLCMYVCGCGCGVAWWRVVYMFVWGVHDEWILAPGRTSRLLGYGLGGVALLVGDSH